MSESLIIDTNLLVLYVVGATDRTLIAKHKRLQAYSVEDFDELAGLVAAASTVLVTPNTLTETSNLVAQIADPARTAVLTMFKQVIGAVTEHYIASTEAAQRNEFLRLGLTDAALLATQQAEAVLLTADLDLYLAAVAANRNAVNFNHLRDRRL